MIVMTGANGRLGRLITHALARGGYAERVTLATRDPAKIADLADFGFRTTRADFDDPDSLRTAFKDATAALIISIPGPVQERIPRHRNAFDAAKSAKVGRLIYTSRVNPSHDSVYPFAEIHAFSEEYLHGTKLPLTIVRNNEYIENVLRYVESAPDPDEVILPGCSGKVAYVAVNDVAEVIAKLMVEDGHVGKIYEINGPDAVSRDDIANILSQITGRTVRAKPVDGVQFSEFMASLGRPGFIVEMVKGLVKAIDAGEFEKVWPDTPMLLGRSAVSIRECLEAGLSTRILPVRQRTS